MIKHFYFVRHGETDWNVVRKLQGQHDVPLNNVGIEQAKALAERLYNLGVKVENIYSSPLMRANKTAEIIASKFGLCVEVNPLLTERCFGCFEGKVVALLSDEEQETFHSVFNEQDNEKAMLLNVETSNQVIERFRKFMNAVPADKDNIILVSHGAFIKSLIRRFLGDDFRVANCACISFDYDFKTEMLLNVMCV